MADWPPSGLSGSGHPDFDYTIRPKGPKLLETMFPDGSENIRVKGSGKVRYEFVEQWNDLSRNDARLFELFFDMYAAGQYFTKRRYRPMDDDDFGTVEVMVRLQDRPTLTQVAPQRWRCEPRFIAHPSEV